MRVFAVFAFAAVFAAGLLAQAPPVVERAYSLACPGAEAFTVDAVNAARTMVVGNIQASVNGREVKISMPSSEAPLVDWLFGEIDRACGAPAAGMTVVRTFNLPQPAPAPGAVARDQSAAIVAVPARLADASEVQEFVNLTRTILDVQRMFLFGGRVVVLRGSPGQVDSFQWLLRMAEESTGAAASPRFATATCADAMRSSSGTLDNAIRATLLPGEPAIGLQEIVNLLRTVTGAQRLFQITRKGLIVSRAFPEQDAALAWVVDQLLAPAAAGPLALSPESSVTLPTGERLSLRVVFAPAANQQQLQAAVNEVRAAGLQRVFSNTSRRAIALAGSPVQIAQASALLASRFAPQP